MCSKMSPPSWSWDWKGYFLCSGPGLCPGARDTGSEFPNSPWAALSVCRTQDSTFKKTRVEKDRPALGDVSGNDRALAAQIPSWAFVSRRSEGTMGGGAGDRTAVPKSCRLPRPRSLHEIMRHWRERLRFASSVSLGCSNPEKKVLTTRRAGVPIHLSPVSLCGSPHVWRWLLCRILAIRVLSSIRRARSARRRLLGPLHPGPSARLSWTRWALSVPPGACGPTGSRPWVLSPISPGLRAQFEPLCDTGIHKAAIPAGPGGPPEENTHGEERHPQSPYFHRVPIISLIRNSTPSPLRTLMHLLGCEGSKFRLGT